jgi:hypothetical protein
VYIKLGLPGRGVRSAAGRTSSTVDEMLATGSFGSGSILMRERGTRNSVGAVVFAVSVRGVVKVSYRTAGVVQALMLTISAAKSVRSFFMFILQSISSSSEPSAKAADGVLGEEIDFFNRLRKMTLSGLALN